MNETRRRAVQSAGGLGLYGTLLAIGLLPHEDAAAQSVNPAAFQAKSVAETLKALGVAAPVDSADIFINAPEIAENGAVVPVGVRSSLANTEMLAVLVEKNPNTLAAVYEIPDGTEPDVNMRIKMGESCDVVAVVKAGGKFYTARKEIKVTAGGCGG
jgi:sulfur-oxidizing protein SoxY